MSGNFNRIWDETRARNITKLSEVMKQHGVMDTVWAFSHHYSNDEGDCHVELRSTTFVDGTVIKETRGPTRDERVEKFLNQKIELDEAVYTWDPEKKSDTATIRKTETTFARAMHEQDIASEDFMRANGSYENDHESDSAYTYSGFMKMGSSMRPVACDENGVQKPSKGFSMRVDFSATRYRYR